MAVELVTRPHKQGDTWRGVAIYCNPDANGNPDLNSRIDLSDGWTARLQVRRRATDPAAILTLTSDPGGGIEVQPDDDNGDPLIGEIHWRARPSLTEDWPVGRLRWELEIFSGDVESDPDADRLTIVTADLQVESQVTR